MHTSATDERRRPPPQLVVDGLTAGYGGATVVDDVSFTVGPGEVVALLGPNGAGKSTVLKAMVGQARITAGSVLLGGIDITSVRPHLLAGMGCGYVPQYRDVFDELTVRENLEMGGYLLGKEAIAKRIDDAMEVFPALAGMMDRPARKLSGGEHKMLAIARVMMSQPTLMALDEPTANLAPILGRRLLDEQIRAVVRSGAAVLLVEQRAAAALSVADWVYLLVAGRVVRSGHPAELRAQADFAEVFLGGGDATTAARNTSDVRA